MNTQTITLDENGKLNKQTVLSSLRKTFSFPDYFGDNWDAAYDLLLDYVDELAGPTTWRFSINKACDVNEADLAAWAQLMTDLKSYAASQGLELQIVIQRDSGA
ncbi:MAG: barstar family protein [Moraxellaceae bacterium]|nr:barstar family protein [Moraxellaceae bacterium]MDP1776892.1 barstar family protein [Moraxellaceae bacterium]